VRLIVAAVAAALVAAAPAAAKPPRGPVKVQLLGINDFHGHLEATTPGRVRPDGRKSDPIPAGGAEHLAHEVRRLRRRNPHTLVVSAGDLIGGSPLLSALFHDEPTIEAMNRIGLDINAVGNHELDEGANELRRMQRGGCHPVDGCTDGNGFRGARFEFLAANVISRRTGDPIFEPYVVKYFKRIPVGFIGLTLEGTPGLVPPHVSAPLRFADEAATINRYARRLRRRHGVRAIVVLLHEGGVVGPRSRPDGCRGLSGPVRDIVARSTSAVDVFLTGHTHSAYNCVLDRRRVTSAGSFGRMITRIELKLSRRTRDVLRAPAENRIVYQRALSTPDISALIARYARLADPVRKRVIGRLATHAGRSRDPSGESKMGNLVADAQRAASGSDIAFTNPGGVRSGLPAGAVTYAGVFRVQPFGGLLVSLTLTGAQIHELLKQQWCGAWSRRVLSPSASVRYSYSRSAANALVGQPCAGAATPVRDLLIHGLPVDPARRYRVTVNSALSEGRDGFPVLRQGTARAAGVRDTEALELYLQHTIAGSPMWPPRRDRILLAP
jgi:5'-nucleotidase